MRTIGWTSVTASATLALAACAAPAESGSDPPSGTDPTEVPSAGASAVASGSAPDQIDDPSGDPVATCHEGVICDGLLLPGSYETDALGPTIRFSLEEPWLGTAPGARSLELQLPEAVEDDAPQALAFARFNGTVFDPTCPDEAEPLEVEPSARAFIDHLVASAAVTPIADPAPITFGGAEGWILDATLSAEDGCGIPLVLLFDLGDEGSWGSVDGEDARIAAVDVDGTTILILMETFPGGDHAGLLEAAEPVLESLAFGTDG